MGELRGMLDACSANIIVTALSPDGKLLAYYGDSTRAV